MDGLCQTNNDCAVGYDCIDSGCDTKEGATIEQCVFAGRGACRTDADCASERYDCIDVPSEGGNRCVKTSPGCDKDLDCIFGFYCEGAESAKSCVDRRVPCVFDEDCPMNHSCVDAGNGQMCVRMHRTCGEDFDCARISQRCADVDEDTVKECAGVLDPNERPPVACLNASCTDPSAPVCQVSGIGSLAVCGQYGLCLDNRDCNTSAGFECVGLWPDGRKECVPTGGSCNDITDCPPQQVCAAPRTTDDPPSCQAGKE
jgi:hypothetical protein